MEGVDGNTRLDVGHFTSALLILFDGVIGMDAARAAKAATGMVMVSFILASRLG